MEYISTRGNYNSVSSAEAIILGMVPAGGLFVPEELPKIDISELKNKSYQEVAFNILKPFLSDDFTDEEIKNFISMAYNEKNFDSKDIAPLVSLDEKINILELWHGPTFAFKDMALQIMPYFLSKAMEKKNFNKEIVILVATSGDTGKAALEGFKDVPHIKIIVFYPDGGVSSIQELQMKTTDGKNTFVVGVKGNFDDCQTMVKQIFANKQFKEELSEKGFELSSANSINWGRLLPQIVYYFWAYLKLLDSKKILFDDKINICVPTGNFGNILAAYYAKNMGLPVSKLICASNSNNVLADFITSGKYDSKRTFYKTISPSMDILISSNLERFLFDISRRNFFKIREWYENLSKNGAFKVDETTKSRLKTELYGNYSTEEETMKEIKETFEKYNYLLDPHTAVAMNVYKKYLNESEDDLPVVISSTASPYKFNSAVYKAITGKDEKDEFKILEELNKITNFTVPERLKQLKELEIKHNLSISIDEAKKTIKKILGIGGKRICLKSSKK
ncbi:MAG: threonine synthase [Brevinematia bacterium]